MDLDIDAADLRPNRHWLDRQAVLDVYGHHIPGPLVQIAENWLELRPDDPEMLQVLGTAHASAELTVPVGSGLLVAPVSCWVMGPRFRMLESGRGALIQRRRHPRAALDVPALLGWTTPNGVRRLYVRTADISTGGLQVQATNAAWPSMGQRVELTLDIPSGAIGCAAEIVGSTPDYGLRMRFVDLTEPVRLRISRIVEMLAADPEVVPGQR